MPHFSAQSRGRDSMAGCLMALESSMLNGWSVPARVEHAQPPHGTVDELCRSCVFSIKSTAVRIDSESPPYGSARRGQTVSAERTNAVNNAVNNVENGPQLGRMVPYLPMQSIDSTSWTLPNAFESVERNGMR